MKDAARSGRVLTGSFGKVLNRDNSRMYNIILIIILISLAAIAVYLVSDILSFRSGAAHEGTLFGLDHQNKGKIAMLESWQEKGVKLAQQGKYREAIECFDKAISENSSDYKALINKGKALYALDSYEEALKCYDKALLLKSSDGEALHNKWLALLAMKRFPPRPANSSNSSTPQSAKSRQASIPVKAVTTSGEASKDSSRIIIDWASVNSNEHSSLDEDYQHNTAAQSTKADKNESNSSNVSYNLPANGSAINSTENSSIAIPKNISILDNSSDNRAAPEKEKAEISDRNVSIGSLEEAINLGSDPIGLDLTNSTFDQEKSDNASENHNETHANQPADPENLTRNSTFNSTNIINETTNLDNVSGTLPKPEPQEEINNLAGSQVSPYSHGQIAAKKRMLEAPKKPTAPRASAAKLKQKTQRTKNNRA